MDVSTQNYERKIPFPKLTLSIDRELMNTQVCYTPGVVIVVIVHYWSLFLIFMGSSCVHFLCVHLLISAHFVACSVFGWIYDILNVLTLAKIGTACLPTVLLVFIFCFKVRSRWKTGVYSKTDWVHIESYMSAYLFNFLDPSNNTSEPTLDISSPKKIYKSF